MIDNFARQPNRCAHLRRRFLRTARAAYLRREFGERLIERDGVRNVFRRRQVARDDRRRIAGREVQQREDEDGDDDNDRNRREDAAEQEKMHR